MMPLGISVLLTNAFVLFSVTIRLDGTILFVQGHRLHKACYLVPIFASAIIAYFFYFENNLGNRAIVSAITSFAISIVIVFQLIRYSPKGHSSIYYLTGFLIFIKNVFYLFFSIGLKSQQGAELIVPELGRMIYFIIFIIADVGMGITFAMLNNQRSEVELEKSNQSLKDSELKYRSLSDAAFEGIVISENGIIQEANKTFGDMFYYDVSEVIGMKSIDFVASEAKTKIGEKINTDFELAYETIGQRQDGSRLPVEIQSKMYVYKGRKTRISAIRDLTEKKKKEDEISILSGLLPICSSCKKIRDDRGYWNQIESYIESHSKAKFSHGICGTCQDKLYGKEEWYKEMKAEQKTEE